MISKQNELEILDAAIAQLGAGSYCGPWLAEIRAEVADNMKSDFYPIATISTTARRCEGMISDARSRAADIGKQADASAAKTIAEARQTAESIRRRISSQVSSALQSLIA